MCRVYIYIYRERERERERQADRQREEARERMRLFEGTMGRWKTRQNDRKCIVSVYEDVIMMHHKLLDYKTAQK
jgi:hypothetical protein